MWRRRAGVRQRIEVEVLFGEEVARGVLRTFPEARDVSAHDNTVSFAYYGDWAGLATLLGRLVQEGVQVTRFGPGPEGYDELAAGLRRESEERARLRGHGKVWRPSQVENPGLPAPGVVRTKHFIRLLA